MLANPGETCLSAEPKLKLPRKRIAKLLQMIDALPNDFIEKAKEFTDPKVLHKMNVKHLLEIVNATNHNRISKKLKSFVSQT